MLTITTHDHVASVQLNRPDVRNAFAPEMIAALTAWAVEAARDTRLRAAVLSGAGSVFCAGADLAWMRESQAYDEGQNLADAERLAEMFDALAALPMPVIARVQGAAIGGGAGLLAVCDHVVAADDLRVGFAEVRIGLLPAVIAPYVVRRIGAAASRSLFLTGRRIDADAARHLGLVHEVVPVTGLDEAVTRAVSDIVAGAPGAQRATKQLLTAIEQQQADVRALAVASIARQRVSPEGQAGLQAFLEKRAPVWGGQEGP